MNLPELIVEVLTFMRPEIAARRVEVKCNWDVALPPVSGDASQLKQFFYNIILNAVQAMSYGGGLEIFGYVTPEFQVVEFADSGRGVGPDELKSIFTAFKTNRAGEKGIGTMVIERVCREHGAEFGIVSTPWRGTVFQVRFPVGGRRLRMIGVSK